MLLLLLSLLALALAPALHRLARSARGALEALDGFVLVAIGGIVLLHIIPHSVEAGGWIALVVAAAGLLGPGMTERLMGRLAKPAHTLALLLAVAAVAVHVFMDGAALGGSVGAHGVEETSTFAIAVILHRIPEGLMIWWLVQPRLGATKAALLLGAVGASTAAGFFGGEAVLIGTAPRYIALFQALVAGSLLHVVTHRPHREAHDEEHDHDRANGLWGGIGALVGIGLLFVILGMHEDEELSAMRRSFVGLALDSSPALLVAYVMSGFVHGLMPRASVAWLRKGTTFSQALRGVLFGMPLPICSCGAVPLYRTFIARGVPPAAAMAFLIAGPEIGIDAALLSIPLLGWQITGVRLGCAFLVALLAALIVAPFVRGDREPQTADKALDGPGGSYGEKLVAGLKYGLGMIVDETVPWILLGVGVAAVLEPVVEPGMLARLPRGLDVPLFALIGMPLYVCASGATPLVAVLIAKGVSPGAAMAFLLTGPATNATTFGIMAKLHGKKAAAAFGISVALLTVAVGYGVNVLLPASVTVPVTAHEHETHGVLSWLALIGMALIVTRSLLRQGPRGFLGQISSLWPLKHKHSEEDEPHDDPNHDPDHEHSHDHEHEDGHAHGPSSVIPQGGFTAAPAKRSMLRAPKRSCGCGSDDCGK